LTARTEALTRTVAVETGGALVVGRRARIELGVPASR
jgi:hypothetical protein